MVGVLPGDEDRFAAGKLQILLPIQILSDSIMKELIIIQRCFTLQRALRSA
jgi:hypothetical protein